MESKQLQQDLEQRLSDYLFNRFSNEEFLNENINGKTEHCGDVAREILALSFLKTMH